MGKYGMAVMENSFTRKHLSLSKRDRATVLEKDGVFKQWARLDGFSVEAEEWVIVRRRST